jgi:hypothetical protein
MGELNTHREFWWGNFLESDCLVHWDFDGNEKVILKILKDMIFVAWQMVEYLIISFCVRGNVFLGCDIKN